MFMLILEMGAVLQAFFFPQDNMIGQDLVLMLDNSCGGVCQKMFTI